MKRLPRLPELPEGGAGGGRPHLLVVGGASLDILHFRGRTVRSAGGAGLYTALAAHRAGADVTMLGPRPRPVPPELAEPMKRLDWRGPEVAPERLPSFEIAHFGDGRSEMRSLVWRAEADLDVDATPADLEPGWAYCIPLADPARQLAFAEHLGNLGYAVACGTYAGIVARDREAVRAILARAEIFFCNEAEAVALFGRFEDARVPAGRLLFITRGPRGARVLQGGFATDVPGVAVEELDATGAGDTFCGTVLARLALGDHPVVAAEHAVVAAADMVTGVGPERLLLREPSPPPPRDARARLDLERVARLAERLATLEEARPYDFTGPGLPSVGHPAALRYFFAATVQQFGFWHLAGDRWDGSMRATIDGVEHKGSDFLWAAYSRWLDEAPGELAPAGQAALSKEVFDRRLRDDGGHVPLPEAGRYRDAARAYGRSLAALGTTPERLVEVANASRRPVATLLRLLDHVGGYREDPLRKKAALLALVLLQRPEAFLRRVDGDPVPPIVDYHVQRSCLRLGLVRVDDEALRRRLEGRRRVDAEAESVIRRACFRATERLVALSGRSMGTVDYFFFENRRRCPEATAPECPRCPVAPACAQQVALFQPVHRTSAY